MRTSADYLRCCSKALKQRLPPEVRSVVDLQLEGVKRKHAQLHAVRDQAHPSG